MKTDARHLDDSRFFPICLTAMFALAGLAFAAQSQTITFTNKVVTFTNLQGQVFSRVTLAKTDMDGVIWLKEASGGRVSFTNLAPELIEAWGIPTNRIETAKTRAEKKAASDARYRAKVNAEIMAKLQAQQEAAAEWARTGPARERAAQMEADLSKIQALRKQIAASEAQLRHESAYVHDYNMANVNNADAPYLYIKQSFEASLEDAKDRLEQMVEDYQLKYGTSK